MASQEYEAFYATLEPGLAIHTDPPEVAREKMLAIHPTDCSDDTIVERLELGGVPAAWVASPEHRDEDRILFHVHGGAFLATGIDHFLKYAEDLSRLMHARVLLFEYRLAPEHPYPAALDDTLAVYRGLLDQGASADRIAFCGDSCGGGIALATLCALRDAGDPLPACLVGLTPWLDAEQKGDSALHPRGLDPFVEAKWIRERFKTYAGERGDLQDPLLSPIHSKLSGLPPLYLSVGAIDTTADDSTRLAERAGREGTSIVVDVNAGMIHGFHGLCGAFPEADTAVARTGDFIRRLIPDR